MSDPTSSYPPQQQQQGYQQNYAPAPQQQYAPAQQSVSLGDWVLSLFVSAIPIVGIVMLFVWGFGSNALESKKNWARAMLIWWAVGIVLSILFTIMFSALIASILSSANYHF